MTGEEHFAEAERLIGLVAIEIACDDCEIPIQATLEMAQVHATLALAAVTAYPPTRLGEYVSGYGRSLS
jgi:hypothetical protein